MAERLFEGGNVTELQALIDNRSEDYQGLSRKKLRDKGKLVDFVLAYNPSKMNESKHAYRQAYEEKLREQGLILNTQNCEESVDNVTSFVKIRAPHSVLEKLAQRNRLPVPIQVSDIDDSDKSAFTMENVSDKVMKVLGCGRNPYKLKSEISPPEKPMYFSSEFNRSRVNEFLIQEGETKLFTSIQRIRMIWELMQNAMVNSRDISESEQIPAHGDRDSVGLNFLMDNGIYCAAYPLHDSDTEFTAYYPQPKPGQMRNWLAEFWARPGRWNKYQPLDEIRSYFGEKVGMYFAWLGLYTSYLIPLSIIGVVSFVYGLASFYDDEPMRDVCFRSPFKDRVICRNCRQPRVCKFHTLDDYCFYTIVNAIIENKTTVPWTMILCVWSVTLLEFSKRYLARLACKWGTIEMHKEYQPPRPEYQLVAKKKRRHPITHEWEPYISKARRSVSFLRSVSTVSFFICVVLAVIIGVIVYRATMVIVYYRAKNEVIDKIGSSSFTTITASVISAAGIVVLEKIYSKIAYFLTERECPRTNEDFENSYTFKMFVFQFLNYYTALFYLAFFQSFDVFSHPSRIADFSDYCSPVGCTFPVMTQLCTVLIVKQTLFNVLEIAKPAARYWLVQRKKTFETAETRHEKDLHLRDYDRLGLLGEYVEMVLQYGFVVMFSALFPLAPLFALINNIAEIRVDSYKLISCKRVFPERAKDIGNWYKILEFITKLAILINAMLIAFTTDLIDRYFYMWYFANEDDKLSLRGYMNFSLSIFNPIDWNNTKLEKVSYDDNETVSQCFYKGYYFEAGHPLQYQVTKEGWIIVLAKVGFVLAFQNLVLWLQSFIKYMVSDQPEDIQLHVLRNHYVARAWLDADESDRDKSAADEDEQQELHADATGLPQVNEIADATGLRPQVNEIADATGLPQVNEIPKPSAVRNPRDSVLSYSIWFDCQDEL